MSKKKISIIGAVVVALAIIGGACGWWFGYEAPHREALASYENAVSMVNSKNKKLDDSLAKLTELIDSKDETLDPQTKKDASEVAKSAKRERRAVGKQPKKTDELNQKASELSKPLDYTATIAKIDEAATNVENGIKQLKQVTEPSQDFVMARLKEVPGILNMAPVTEDNDPNGNLNKAGGYTSPVYFESQNVDQSTVYGNDLIDKGTDAGGAIETYKTNEDVTKRDTYLGALDGGILSSGSHKVIGTVLIRTSNELTATQQNELTQAIINALTRLE